MSEFHQDIFEQKLRVFQFDLNENHRKEFKDFCDLHRKNDSDGGSIFFDLRSKMKAKHLKEYLNIVIKSIIESYSESTDISDSDTKLLENILFNHADSFINQEKRGLQSVFASQGLQIGSSVVDNTIKGCENKLYQIKSVAKDLLNISIREHNKNVETVKPIEKKPKAKTKVENLTVFNEKIIWEEIKNEFEYSKNKFGKKINFVKDPFKRKIIFRDIAQSYYLAKKGCYKPGVILAGGVIEELLKLFLEKNKVKPRSDSFNDYIKCCEQYNLLKAGISRLSDSVRQFRNLVHVNNEKTNKYTLSKATAIGAVTSVFTIANDF